MKHLTHRSSDESEVQLVILNGAEKGTKYQLAEGRFTIGRGGDSDIKIKDDAKISRMHVEIIIKGRIIEISDISGRNKLVVNDTHVHKCLLGNGDIIQVGETKIKLEQKNALQPALDSSTHNEHLPKSRSRPRSAHKANANKINFYIVTVLLLSLFAWLMTSQNSKKEVHIRTSDDVQTTIDANSKVLEVIEAEREKSGVNSQQYKEAQPNFIKGFRDYRKGQFERAIESFQACLSLFPAHAQCKTYLDRSLKKFSELVQYHMILANKYRSQNQYAACKASYRNAMVMLKNKNDKTFQEAKSGHDLCEALDGGRF